VRTARAEGRPYKLVCQAEKRDGRVTASVRPQQVETGDPLATVGGASSIVIFEMDTLYGLTLSEINPDAITTAYGPLADFITIARAER
jgi:homoserine dehydrogenase